MTTVPRTVGVDLRLVPPALAGWLGAWVATSGSRQLLVAGLVGLAAVAAAAASRRSAWLTATGLVLAGTMAIGAVHHHLVAHGPVAELASERAVVEVTVTLTSDPVVKARAGPKPGYLAVRGRTSAVTGRGDDWVVRSPVLLLVSQARVAQWQHTPVGSRVQVTARLQPAPAGSDLAALARVSGDATPLAKPSRGMRIVNQVRQGLRSSLADRRAEPRALVPALVLGDTSQLSSNLTDDFQTTGLTHLTAVSGANLTLLLATMLLVARWLGVRGWWLRGVGLLGVVVFVGLCRSEPSVLRAAAMGVVALAALGAGGVQRGIRSLSVAMVVLLMIDPFLSRTVGFVLSVLASGGIICWAGRWSAILSGWMPKIVADSITVPWSAHLATLPVVATLSGHVSVVGLIANALAGPFVGPATVFGFLAAGVSLLSIAVATVPAWVAAGAAQLILWVAHAGAEVPGASRTWPTTPAALVLLGAIALVGALLTPYVLARPSVSAGLAAAMVVSLAVVPGQPGWPPTGWLMVACDVGQGDAIVIRVAHRQAMVVDAGPDPRAMDTCLRELDISAVPVLILSHFHADHVDGLPGVLRRRRVGEVWVSPLASPAGEASRVARVLSQQRTPARTPEVGERGTVGDISWQVIGPTNPGSAAVNAAGREAEASESSTENDASLVVMVTVRGVRLLLTGDVEPAGQSEMLATGTDLRADVLKVPHHGSARQLPEFFVATGAQVALVSAGQDNDYGHPAPQTLRLSESLRMKMVRTDTHGGVGITLRDGALVAFAQRWPTQSR